jgi:hypothetical protein
VITAVDLPSRDAGVFTNTGSPELVIELESELDDVTDDDDSGLFVSRSGGAEMVEDCHRNEFIKLYAHASLYSSMIICFL